jgi:formylglycine-generating enzyme required for sulfatase activity
VTYVGWFDAARFCNWLHNGQPTGLQVAGTTETGAYALSGATLGVGFTRGGGAQYWIPSESEWYKAAYYQPAAAGGDADGYWLYPMQTNSAPYSDQPAGATPDNTRVGNFNKNDSLVNGYDDGYAVSGSTSYPSGNPLTPVGAYTASDSYYGTFDQGGNVWEWNETIVVNARGLRGGGWMNDEFALWAHFGSIAVPEDDNFGFGFRVASVPEPTVSVSLMLAGGLLLARRKRPSAL